MNREKRRLRLGTRQSALALAQSGLVARALEGAHPGLDVELVRITTQGDVTPGDLSKIGGKGLFTEELEAGLLDGSLDLAVHSLKDLPVTLPDGLDVAAFPPRADARDALVSETAASLDELPEGARLLTGSLRRRSLLLRHRPDLDVVPVRGNVDTRLRKWRETGADGVILAAAGLERLDTLPDDLPVHPLDPTVVVPAPGQGTLALETASATEAARLCRALNHPETAASAIGERAVVAAFGGDCTLPLAAHCFPAGGGDFRLRAFLALPDGNRWVEGESTGAEPRALAAAIVEDLRRQGAQDILDRLDS